MPLSTAKAFIEAEVHPDYDKLLAYVEIMLGIEWAKRIADNYADRPGAPNDNQNASKNNRHAHDDCFEDKLQRGTNKAYLLERLPDEVVAEIGRGDVTRSKSLAVNPLLLLRVLPLPVQAAGQVFLLTITVRKKRKTATDN